MLKSRLVVHVACSVFILVSAVAIAAQPAGTAQNFKLAIDSNMEMALSGNTQKVDADTEIRYAWHRKGKQSDLIVQSLLVKASADGAEVMNSFMSRAKVANTQQGQTTELPFAQAPAELQTMLRDSFDVPVCTRETDETGRELKRTIVAGPGAKTLLDNGLVANAVLFHGPYMVDKNEWQADSEVSMGNGGYAKGKLNYKKVPGGKGGQVVQVSGTLTNETYTQPGTPLTVKDTKYVVNGRELYDPAQHEWVLGKLNMNITFRMTASDMDIGTAKGTMAVNFEKLQDKP
jgi:hypothetical protein